MLRNLHSINLRALPTCHLPLDRILTILSNNPQLTSVSFHFQGVLPAVLPLATVTLPDLNSLSLGGHFLFTNLIDQLVLPSLKSLILDIEARDPIEDVICSLLNRSNNPPVAHLAVGYSSPPHLPHHHHPSGSGSSAATFYYGAGTGMMVIGWPTLLTELEDLTSLCVGNMALEPLLSALGPPDDDALSGLNPPVTQFLAGNGSNQNIGGGPGGSAAAATANGWTWASPRLEKLSLKGCHAHNDGINRLVQMVEARNPPLLTSASGPGALGAGGAVNLNAGIGMPDRLKKLEMYDCTNLGEDVMRWLGERIEEVTCSEPVCDRYESIL